jgi:hypothetical protein
MNTGEVRDLATKPHLAELALDRAPEREGELGDGVFDEIRRGLSCAIRHCLFGAILLPPPAC